jgi:hypothetical protein
MAARLVQDFSVCVGVELLDDLHRQSLLIAGRYESSYRGRLYAGHRQDVAVVHGSLLDLDWSDGDVVFANSTCFEDDLMHSMTRQAERLKPGAIVGE